MNMPSTALPRWARTAVAGLLAAALAAAQAPPIVIPDQSSKPAPAAQVPAPAAPPAAAPAPAAKPGAAPAPAPAPTHAVLTDAGGFLLQNVSLVELIDILARRLKINYILDPRVKGSVTINTYGEVRPTELMPLLQTILRINGAAIVQVGDLYRIVPLTAVKQLPITPTVNGKNLPSDERLVLNMVFLKYATVDEMAKVLQPFLGEGAEITTYPAANLLLILDNARNMSRTMDLIAMFDSDTFAGQRVRLLEVTNGRPSDLSKELDSVFKAYALSEKSSGVKFLPIDRINTIIAVAPNPGIFTEVEKWLKKLDIPVKVTAGSVNNYVYRLKYGRAETVSMAIMALYTGNTFALSMFAAGGMGMYGGMGMSGMGGMYGGGMGGGMYGGMGGMYGGGMYGGMAGMNGMYPGYNPGAQGAWGGGSYNPVYTSPSPGTPGGALAAGGAAVAAGGADLTGSFLGTAPASGSSQRIPHVIPNPFDNTLLVQGTPQEWEQISNLLEQLDVPPRQVLIEARIYEVDLTGAFASGVAAYLKSRDDSSVTTGSDSSSTTQALARTLLGSATGSGLNLTAGILVGRSRQLLGLLTAQETSDHARVISEPSIIATDSIPASINVGQEVPTLSSQALTGAQQGGSSLFANTVSNRNSGVTLAITARVNSSGIVTMMINQEVSKPEPPPATAAIQSPSFSKRNVQTQVTVQDGDTIAIGGIIQETETRSSAGVPVLHRIPVLGAAFGNKSLNKARTELVIFLTPRVIYDTNQIAEASGELTDRLKRLKRIMKSE